LTAPADAEAKSNSTNVAPRIVASGGDIGVDVTLAMLTSAPEPGGRAVDLDVGAPGRINSLDGEFGLRRLEGRIQGARGSSRAGGMARLVRMRGAIAAEPAAGAGVRGRQGQLIDVDVSGLPSVDVAALARLHVLSPSPAPL